MERISRFMGITPLCPSPPSSYETGTQTGRFDRDHLYLFPLYAILQLDLALQFCCSSLDICVCIYGLPAVFNWHAPGLERHRIISNIDPGMAVPADN